MSEFPLYQPSSSDSDPPPSGRQPPPGQLWYVLVEVSNHGQAKPPTRIEFGLKHGLPDLESAIAAAERLAFEYQPPDPWAPKGRQVFQTGERQFLTLVEGATSTFQFITRVGLFRGAR